jgi:hypothetical protein
MRLASVLGGRGGHPWAAQLRRLASTSSAHHLSFARHPFSRRSPQLAVLAAAAPVVAAAAWVDQDPGADSASFRIGEQQSGLGVYCMPNERNKYLWGSIPKLKRDYVPFSGDSEGHAETLAGSLIRETPPVTYARHSIRANDGGTVSLDFLEDVSGFPLCVTVMLQSQPVSSIQLHLCCLRVQRR